MDSMGFTKLWTLEYFSTISFCTKTLFQKLLGLKWAISCKKILIGNIFEGHFRSIYTQATRLLSRTVLCRSTCNLLGFCHVFVCIFIFMIIRLFSSHVFVFMLDLSPNTVRVCVFTFRLFYMTTTTTWGAKGTTLQTGGGFHYDWGGYFRGRLPRFLKGFPLLGHPLFA